MKKLQHKIKILGVKKPASTERNRMIKRAVKKAAKDYRTTFVRLANT